MSDLTETVCLVTGANAGIGLETTRHLAQQGATVVMVCRSRERGEAARDAIHKDTGSDRLDLMLADLASQQAIHDLAEAFHERYDRLDVLINNAGSFFRDRRTTPEGLEMTFALNHLAPFLLTNLLLDHLQTSAPARVVTVTSKMHYRGRLDFDDLQKTRSYDGIQAYADSKLANVLFTYELARRLEGTGVTATCVHPGVVATNIWSANSGWLRIFAPLIKLFMISPARGAAFVTRLAVDPDLEGVTGVYVDQEEQTGSAAASYDEELARRLWRVSAELTGLSEEETA